MKIAVIGAAGWVGAPAVFYLAANRLADEFLMIGGKRQNFLQQHAIDISTAVSSRLKRFLSSDLAITSLTLSFVGSVFLRMSEISSLSMKDTMGSSFIL